MVASAGAGPQPIPSKSISSQALQEAIRFCLTPEAETAAIDISMKMRVENGVKAAVASFHRNLPSERHRCDVLPHLPAAWTYNKAQKQLKLSKVGSAILLEYLRIEKKNLKS